MELLLVINFVCSVVVSIWFLSVLLQLHSLYGPGRIFAYC